MYVLHWIVILAMAIAFFVVKDEYFNYTMLGLYAVGLVLSIICGVFW